jgi:hypothetical protein
MQLKLNFDSILSSFPIGCKCWYVSFSPHRFLSIHCLLYPNLQMCQKTPWSCLHGFYNHPSSFIWRSGFPTSILLLFSVLLNLSIFFVFIQFNLLWSRNKICFSYFISFNSVHLCMSSICPFLINSCFAFQGSCTIICFFFNMVLLCDICTHHVLHTVTNYLSYFLCNPG